MKTGFLVSTLVALVLAVVVVMGMGQISGLKKEMADLKKEVPAKSAKGRTAVGTGARISRPSSNAYERKTSARGEEDEEDEEAEEQSEVEKLVKQAEDNPEELLGDLIKAFSESDFGQRMQRDQNARRAKSVFSPLLEEFGFSEQEEEAFLEIAGGDVGSEEALWGRVMFADEEEREEIMQEWEASADQRKKDMQAFLNNEDDWRRYQDYEARVPVYQQMNGIRGAMEGAGVPLSSEQETQLVEIMHQARMDTNNVERWEGRGVLEQVSQPGIVDRLQSDFNAEQDAMGNDLAQLLSAEQVEIFNKNRSQTLQGLSQGLGWMESGLGRRQDNGGDK